MSIAWNCPAKLLPPRVLVMFLVLLGSHAPAEGAPLTGSQRGQLRAADTMLKRAGNLYRGGKTAEAGKLLDEVQQSLDELKADTSSDMSTAAEGLTKRLAKARELMKDAGAQTAPAARDAKDAGNATGKKRAGKNDKPGVSFTRQIAPLLVARCRNCHIQRARGELSMGSYASLGKGAASGSVIMPGDAQGSRIVEVIASGDMPRGGGKVTAEELALLVAWINEGAKFDGVDSAAPLVSFAPAKPAEAPARLPVVAAAATDEVQFARDVAPQLIENCLECHGDENPRKQLNMSTFGGLLSGGDSGAIVAPGKPRESLLLKKLRGQAGDRMPLERPPLADEALAKIETWIASGAKFDGADPAVSLEDTVALVTARRASHDELSASRAQLAAKNWRLILPDAKSTFRETPNVLVYGNVSAELLSEVAQAADEQTAKLAKFFKQPADAPLVRGRLTLYVFDKRYDYGEVGTMLEHREIPAAWQGHWHASGVDAYGCLLITGDRVPAGLVAQQIAGAYVGSLGTIPRWFAEGTARAVAAKADAKDPRIKLWDDQVSRIVQAADKPEAFLSGDLPSEACDILSYSFARLLMNSAPRYAALIAALQRGQAFDEAFAKSFGASPMQMAAVWKTRAVRRGR